MTWEVKQGGNLQKGEGGGLEYVLCGHPLILCINKQKFFYIFKLIVFSNDCNNEDDMSQDNKSTTGYQH